MKKRIVICADGTWNDPEDENPTNVLALARAIRPRSSDGVEQVVFYDWGVGSYYSKAAGGATGLGMSKNIQDGYRFIVQNYSPGDELFLFGFSRGAYTVRCLAGMLNNCGVVKRSRADRIPEAFDLYKSRRAKPGSDRAKAWRRRHAVRGRRGEVAFIGVWDTVGALGIPTRALAFAEERDLFFDRGLGSNVRVARHAVSIDEKRADFRPTLWDPRDSVDLLQVWFAGVHADVGGGYAPAKDGTLLSDVPLRWMIEEARGFGLGVEGHVTGGRTRNPLAPAHRSYKRFYRLLGSEQRAIPADAEVHSSVRARYRAGDYAPKPLRRWLAANGEPWG